MITVTTVSCLQEADAMRLRLETSGIAVFLPDEFLNASIGAGNMFEGVRIQVAEADAPRAREILAIPDASDATNPLRCPTCGSGDVAFLRSWLGAVISFLLAGLFLVRRPVPCACRLCGHTWREAQ